MSSCRVNFPAISNHDARLKAILVLHCALSHLIRADLLFGKQRMTPKASRVPANSAAQLVFVLARGSMIVGICHEEDHATQKKA